MRLVFFTLIFLGFSLCAVAQFLPDSLYPRDTLTITYHSVWTQKHYPEKIAEFKKVPLTIGNIVFLGNSITEQGGDWGKLLGWSNVKNRGVSGDVTEGVLKRLGEITYTQPKAVFLLIGINDLFNPATTPEYVVNNILEIIAIIHKESPDTKLYVQNILPTESVSLKEKIQLTNELLQQKESEKPFILLNIHMLFADERDLMMKKYTNDGVHLNEQGYIIWANYLKEQIKSFN